MKIPQKFLVRLEKPQEDALRIVGADGVFTELYLATQYAHKEHARIYGEVVAIPESLSTKPIRYYQEERWKSAEVLYTESDIDISEIEVGDRLYFHFGVVAQDLFESDDVELSNQRLDGSLLYVIEPNQVFCVVKKGSVVIPIGGKILVKPIESGEEVLSPSGLVLHWREKGKRRELQKGIVKHIGRKLKNGFDVDVKEGDVIIFSKNSDFSNRIEGEELFVMDYERDVLGVFERGV